MLIDISELDSDKSIETDICIIGGGASGITLARQFLAGRHRVVLLESGGADYEVQIQELAEGDNEGLPYYDIAGSRLRFFGGTTAIWGGRSAELDPIDFQHREWVPYSGWPVSARELEVWYERARDVLGLPRLKPEESIWADLGITPPEFDRNILQPAFWQFDEPPGRFSLGNCDDLSRAQNITIITHASVNHIQAQSNGKRIGYVNISDPGGHRGRVAARFYVIATGGIENARLLLDSDDVFPKGIGNGRDLVGRFFMEHPHARGGRIITEKPWRLLNLFSDTYFINGCRIASCLRPGDLIQNRHRGLNTSFTLAVKQHPNMHPPLSMRIYQKAKHDLPPSQWNRNMWLALKKSVKRLQRYTDPYRPWLQTVFGRYGIYAVIRAEQSPNPDSRVRLGDQRDSLGMRRTVLDWRMTELDKHGARVAMRALDMELRRLQLGRLELASWLKESDKEWEFDPLISTHPIGGFHHMGTTRMAGSASEGVVDPDCRVFGTDNLFVAGSSVFPTGGWANPTLTLLALTLRLGDHLQERCQDYDSELMDTGVSESSDYGRRTS